MIMEVKELKVLYRDLGVELDLIRGSLWLW